MLVDPLSLMKGVTPGELVPDEDRKGYMRYRFSPRELEVALAYLRDQVATAEKADEARCEAILKNRRAYQARENERERVITLPLIKKDVNQQAANLVNAIMSKDPVCTVRPEEAGKTLVQILAGDPGEQGVEALEVTAEEEAEALQLYGENLVRRRIPFRKRIEAAANDMCRGGMPHYKISWEATTRSIKDRKLEKRLKAETGAEEVYLETVRRKFPIDEPLKFEVIDGINVLMPPGFNDVQASPWFSHRYELSPTDIRHRFADGRFDLSTGEKPDPETIEAICGRRPKTFWQELREDAANMLGLDITDRAAAIPIYEIWFYWPRYVDDGQIEILSLCGQLTLDGEGHLLSCYENFYAHGERPFVPCFQRPDPYEWFSGSTADDLRPLQNLWTALYHITVKNGTQAITKAYKAIMNSPGLRSLREQAKGGGLPPGAIVEVGRHDEIEPFQTGGTFGSLSTEMGTLANFASALSVVPEYQNIPNRTPTGTTSAIMAEAKAQGQQTLERFRESTGAAFKMLIQTCQQFEVGGRAVPFRDPKTRAILERWVGFPVETITNQYSFEITATADEDTKQALRDAETVNLNLIRESNKSIGEMIFDMLNAETPQFLEPVTMQLILREEEQLKRVLKLAHKDYAEYTFDKKDLTKMLLVKRQFLEEEARKQAEAQAQQAAQQQPQAPPMPPPGPMPPMPPQGAPPEAMAAPPQFPAGAEPAMPPGATGGGGVPPQVLAMLAELGAAEGA